MADYCWCGKELKQFCSLGGFIETFCIEHGTNYKTKPNEKQKRVRYSGKSKSPFGRYEER